MSSFCTEHGTNYVRTCDACGVAAVERIAELEERERDLTDEATAQVGTILALKTELAEARSQRDTVRRDLEKALSERAQYQHELAEARKLVYRAWEIGTVRKLPAEFLQELVRCVGHPQDFLRKADEQGGEGDE